MTGTPGSGGAGSGWVRDALGSVAGDDIRAQAARLHAGLRAAGHRRTAVAADSGRQLVLALLMGQWADTELVLAGPTVPAAALEHLGPQGTVVTDRSSGLPRLVPAPGAAGHESARPTVPGLWVFSSGTTGEPKPRHWPWAALLSGGLPTALRGAEHWGVGYAPFTYAGVAATAQALARASRIEFLTPRAWSRRAAPESRKGSTWSPRPRPSGG
ncbi:hypothetical protein GXW83_23845 [Streptacidiphilus sp. PB12-B1b]|uniref:hypothetical protein n=1 Tax=Streptacidiphilus sp. PB12-B1b TaxID=2705012 RepID=UPI0015FD78D2|nr:hypothetical protein [Streptacidiphilus sp. PB12-B1b]QMU78285.1 hypothetical protein GXW83_23845 [Streptacidiphilus sp. PB12-B1b]